MMNHLFFFCFALLLDGVFGADDVTVSVMKGDSVTLPINAGKIKGDERLQWKFGNTDIATSDLEVKPSQPNYPDERFTNRLTLDHKTGSLNISNIKTSDTGKYQLEIMGISDQEYKTLKTFSVTVTDEVESVSGMEGESFYLDSNTQTQSDDVIEWKFKNTVIAKVNRTEHPISDHVLDERFRDRLHVNLFGSLIIRNIKTEDSGLYHVIITNSKYIIQKRFSVTVTESTSRSHWNKAGPALVSVLVIIVIVLFSYIIYIKKRAKKNEINGSYEAARHN